MVQQRGEKKGNKKTQVMILMRKAASQELHLSFLLVCYWSGSSSLPPRLLFPQPEGDEYGARGLEGRPTGAECPPDQTRLWQGATAGSVPPLGVQNKTVSGLSRKCQED